MPPVLLKIGATESTRGVCACTVGACGNDQQGVLEVDLCRKWYYACQIGVVRGLINTARMAFPSGSECEQTVIVCA
jgi:hypothetical protein